MSKKEKLHGKIQKAVEYNTGRILKGLPVRPKNQIIEILLDECVSDLSGLINKKITIKIENS